MLFSVCIEENCMFYIYYPILWLITWLPLRVLYLLSDLCYPVIYYLIPYRKKITRKNIHNAFPDKTEKELRQIERKFYRYFCDMFIETLYMMHMSKAEMKKRFDVGDNSIIKQYYSEGKSVMLMTAHYNNWEWGSSFSMGLPENHPTYNIYKHLKNERFGELMEMLRSRFGGQSIEMKELLRTMVRFRNDGLVASFAMISDQSPARKSIHYWTNFLHQDTAVISGTEQLARKFDYPVVYVHINRLKRGYYRCEYFPIADKPGDTADFEITEKYIRILEQKIQEEPAYWLWTHKRWKHKRKG